MVCCNYLFSASLPFKPCIMKEFIVSCVIIPFGVCAQNPINKQVVTDVSNVKVLNLSRTGLQQIPVEIQNYTNLEELIVSDNQLIQMSTGVQFPESLRKIDISGNPGLMQMPLIKALEPCRKLESVKMSGCGLNYLSIEWASFKNLKSLDVSNNAIAFLPVELSRLKKLESLDVSYNCLSVAQTPFRFKAMKELDVSYNENLDMERVFGFLPPHDVNIVVAGPVNNLGELPEGNGKINQLVLYGCRHEVDGNNWIEESRVEQIALVSPGPAFINSFLRVIARNNHLKSLSLLGMETLPDGIEKLVRLKELELSIKKVTVAEANALKDKLKNTKIVWQMEPETGGRKRKISPPVQGLNVEAETYTVDPAIETSLQSTSVKMYIPRYAFVTSEGTVYQEPVVIQYREFLDPVDIFFSGIPMEYDSAGIAYNFSSAGMFEFNAFTSSGEKLFPNPEALIDVAVVAANPQCNYPTYFFNEQEGRWDYVSAEHRAKGDFTFSSKSESSGQGQRLVYGSMGADDRITVGQPLMWNQTPVNSNIRVNPPVMPASEQFQLRVQRMKGTRTFSIEYIRNTAVQHRNERILKLEESRLLGRSMWVYDGTDFENVYELMKDLHKTSHRALERPGGKKIRSTNKYFRDIFLTANLENDNYDLTIITVDTSITIPVSLHEGNSSLHAIQGKNEKFLKKYNQLLMSRQNIWQDAMDEYRLAAQRYAEQLEKDRISLLENMKNTASLLNDSYRVFSMSGFGIWNCDAIDRMKKPVSMRADFVAENGDKIEQRELFVLNLSQNGVLRYGSRPQFTFDSHKENSIIVVKEDGTLGFLNPEQVKKGNALRKFPAMNLIKPGEMTIDDLKKLLM